MTLDHYILDENHKTVPCDTDTWAQEFEVKDRHVCSTILRQKNRLLWFLGFRPDYWVSTVFLGLDQNYGGGPPLLFETMVFRRWPAWKAWLSDPNGRFLGPLLGTERPPFWLRALYRRNDFLKRPAWFPRFHDWSENSDQDMDRYSTWDEAEKGHRDMVNKWIKGCQEVGTLSGQATVSD